MEQFVRSNHCWRRLKRNERSRTFRTSTQNSCVRLTVFEYQSRVTDCISESISSSRTSLRPIRSVRPAVLLFVSGAASCSNLWVCKTIRDYIQPTSSRTYNTLLFSSASVQLVSPDLSAARFRLLRELTLSQGTFGKYWKLYSNG